MKKRTRSLHWLPKALLAAVILAAFLFALSRLQSGSGAVQRRQLEDSIRRACVACYAAEGVYPPTLAYLETHYGIQVDNTRYNVFYEVFAENLMPEITVVNCNS